MAETVSDSFHDIFGMNEISKNYINMSVIQQQNQANVAKGVFRRLSIICDGTSLWKWLTTFSH